MAPSAGVNLPTVHSSCEVRPAHLPLKKQTLRTPATEKASTKWGYFFVCIKEHSEVILTFRTLRRKRRSDLKGTAQILDLKGTAEI